ncbi:MAG: metal ABC transporter ATP-binding protein [Alphaproteobacteria bacterium]|nr:metal ABC transporter ATP-binding protein [Alphaproteobacteria bacterium]
MTDAENSVLTLQNVIVTYRRVPAVHHVTGSIKTGSLTAIAGPNGAGKSTLLKALMGLVPLSDGEIDRGGRSPRDFAYLPQQPEIDRSFPISVIQTVLLGAWPRSGIFGAVGSGEKQRAHNCIEKVGLTGYAETPIAHLSAGQWQRALFARLIMQDASIILLDEPFAAVDEATTTDLLGLIKAWHAETRTVVAVLHENALIAKDFPETLLLAREVVAWGPTSEVMTSENLERAQAMTRRWAREAHAHPRAPAAQVAR